jgi:hypothetical protein
MVTSTDVIRDVVRSGATLLPQVVAVVELCRTDPNPRQDLARACGTLIGEYGQLRERLAELTCTPLIKRIDCILYLQQRVVDEAAHLAFRPRSDRWARAAQSFGDGLTSSADELLALAAHA